MVARFEVSKTGVAVLRFKQRPGVLVSTAPRPVGLQPPKHPFIDAQSLDAGFEEPLAALLSSVSSAPQFIEALRGAGYDVNEVAS